MKLGILIAGGLLALCGAAQAATFSANSAFNVKTTHSSAGAPCEFDCWEMWQSTADLGMFMVVKDSAGSIVAAGRLTDPYFYDLYTSVDEATRKIPSAQQITRYGTVRTTAPETSCMFECIIAVDFGTTKDVVLGLNTNSKVEGVKEITDAVILPQPEGPNYGGDDPGHPWNNACGAIRSNCAVYFGIGQDGVSEIWVWVDANGKVLAFEVVYANGMRSGKIKVK